MPKKSQLEELFAIHLKEANLPPPVRELRFAPPRRWRFDFAWPEYKIALEIEGGTWMKRSRHTSGAGFQKDCEKYNAAALAGWFVYRVTGGMVNDLSALETITEALNSKQLQSMSRAGS